MNISGTNLTNSRGRRFPGINPFQTEEQDRFFGRDDDIRELYDLISLEKVVVLFGKSGHGKSSLLNAGIVPRFLKENPATERHYEPVTIKFGAYVYGAIPPVEKARQFLENGLTTPSHNQDIGHSLLDIGHSTTLWSTAKRSTQRRIVLIFDQFEEFFTYPLPQQQRFAEEIGELLHTDMPPELAVRYAELPEDLQDFLAEKMDVKAVFAIREDRLHLLDKLKYPLPAIFARRYPLQPLSRVQAREALVKPAGLGPTDEQPLKFETPSFSFSNPALEKILDYLADNEGWVETNQLQILAESFEKRAETEGLTQFTPDELGPLKKIVADYYHEKIGALPDPTDRINVRRLCEEGLAQDGEPPIRLNLHEAQIRNFYNIAPTLLEELVRLRLLRAEPGVGSGYTYELPHDTLLEPVLDARRERHEADAKQQEQEAAAIAEHRAQEAEALAEEEGRRAKEAERLKDEALDGRRRARILAVVAGTVAVFAMGAMGYAFQKKNEALAAKLEAQMLQGIAVQRLAETNQAQAGRDRLEINTLKSRGRNLYRNGFYQSAMEMYLQADTLAQRHALNFPDMQMERDTLHQRILECTQKIH